MTNIKRSAMSLLLFGIGITIAHAQQATTAAGGNSAGSGGTVAYSVGQIVYTTHVGTNGSVAQGVQQPYEISIVLGSTQDGIHLHLQVYPNPSREYLTLDCGSWDISALSLELVDMFGKSIETRKITSGSETISLVNLPSTTYFLKVSDTNTVVKTFKIIKL